MVKNRVGSSNLLVKNRAQASLEMTLAMIGTLILFAGSLKVCIWMSERLVLRQSYYECTRARASVSSRVIWSDPASSLPLNVFGTAAETGQDLTTVKQRIRDACRTS